MAFPQAVIPAYRSTPALETLSPLVAASLAVILIGVVLRHSWTGGLRFQPDEALYATWARMVASGQDVWLATRVVDKPPLFIYTLAALFATVGASEEIARIPNLIANLCTIGLTYAIAMELYGDHRVAGWSAGFMALSPLTIAFAPTTYTDPTMVAWWLMALWLGCKRRYTASGLSYGLSLATKPDAILLAPLLIWLLVRPSRGVTKSALGLWLVGCAIPLAAVTLWSAARPQPDFLQAGLNHIGGLSMVEPARYFERLAGWLHLAQAFAPELLWALLGIGLLSRSGRMHVASDAALWCYLAFWLVVHTAVSFPIWDRYLLPLSPIVALLAGHAVTHGLQRLRQSRWRSAAAPICLVWLVAWAGHALSDESPIGRDIHQYDGIDQVGQYFWAHDTSATVLYVHDLSWDLDYYTFGQNLDRRWVPDGASLASDAAHMPLARRFAVLAAGELADSVWMEALARERLHATPVLIGYRPGGRPSLYLFDISPLESDARD
ncbi:MAG: glycosyltransferase family 39 protein [Chloroflexi bacterium]|nr:glycosyltransferase family 39 protein [Chloroflexota bacterium]